MTKTPNIFLLLRRKEYGCNNYSSVNFKLMRHLILQKTSTFKTVWKFESKQVLCFECGKLYSKNYRKCHDVFAYPSKPRVVYILPEVPAKKRITDCLISASPHGSLMPKRSDHYHCLLALTEDNYLLSYATETGELLYKIHLSQKYKFKKILWNEEEDTIALNSTHNTNPSFMAIMLFTVAPLRFKAMVEISKQVFGTTLHDAQISFNILITLHKPNHVVFYNFEEITKQYTVNNDPAYFTDLGCLGNRGGFTPTIIIKEKPPELFRATSEGYNVIVGGSPWKYIVSPKGYPDRYKVYDMEHKQLILDGDFEEDTSLVYPTKCYFHLDNSGRVVFVTGRNVKMLKFSLVGDSFSYRLDTDFVLPAPSTAPAQSTVSYTSSGRATKPTTKTDCVAYENEEVYSVDYEIDMQLIIVGSNSFNGCDDNGVVTFYDNITGEKLKEVILNEKFVEYHENTLILDKDVLVHLTKCGSISNCTVYQLQRQLETQTETKTRRTRRKRR